MMSVQIVNYNPLLLERSMENIFMLAKREMRRAHKRQDLAAIEAWGHVIRFCVEAGMQSSILRTDMTKPEGKDAAE